jgi:hypothetical protein
MTLVVIGAGGLGGVVASILSEDRGFIKPTKVAAAAGTVYRPGWIGLILTGGIGSWLSWGLYGSVSNAPVTGGSTYTLTMGTICGAVLVGAGGSKWLSSQVDKTLLQQAAAAAAVAGPARPAQAQTIATGSPAEVLHTARSLAAASPAAVIADTGDSPSTPRPDAARAPVPAGTP